MHSPETQAAATVLIPGIVAAATRAGWPKRLAPLLALAFGVAVAVSLAPTFARHDMAEAVLEGLGIGLAAIGLHERGRAALARRAAP